MNMQIFYWAELYFKYKVQLRTYVHQHLLLKPTAANRTCSIKRDVGDERKIEMSCNIISDWSISKYLCL